MNKQNFYFSQSMLTKLSNMSASTISRLTARLELKTGKSEVRKKYDFEETRIILREIIGREYEIDKRLRYVTKYQYIWPCWGLKY